MNDQVPTWKEQSRRCYFPRARHQARQILPTQDALALLLPYTADEGKRDASMAPSLASTRDSRQAWSVGGSFRGPRSMTCQERLSLPRAVKDTGHAMKRDGNTGQNSCSFTFLQLLPFSACAAIYTILIARLIIQNAICARSCLIMSIHCSPGVYQKSDNMLL